MAGMQPESFARWSPDTTRTPADVVVRLGAEGDVAACVRLVLSLDLDDEAAWRQTLTRTVQDGERRALFVAEAGGHVVGYGRVVHTEPDRGIPSAAPRGWYLLGLVVDRAWRRRGIGEALTKARMAWVAERSDRLYYFTGHGNLASQALHERLGFRPLPGGWIPPGGTPEDARTQRFYSVDLQKPHHP